MQRIVRQRARESSLQVQVAPPEDLPVLDWPSLGELVRQVAPVLEYVSNYFIEGSQKSRYKQVKL